VENIIDLYTDYLIAHGGKTTATGLATVLNNQVSHDKITRLLNSGAIDSKLLWKTVKPLVHEISSSAQTAYLIIDDSIEEKQYTDENDLISWHFDHTFGRTIKGVNFLTALYHTNGISLPIAVEFVKKDLVEIHPQTGKEQRKSSITKNELFRSVVRVCNRNAPFQYVLSDSWFASSENMKTIKEELNKDFIMAIKSNRKVALTVEDKQAGKYQAIESVAQENEAIQVWVEQLDFAILIIKKVFKNEDGSVGILYLATSDLKLNANEMSTHYQKRWRVEEYHKSLKSNTSFAQSPTKTVQTQTSHFIASILAFIKLEILKQRNKLNHFAMKAKIFVQASKVSLQALAALSTNPDKYASI
jgi:hypothetical protein